MGFLNHLAVLTLSLEVPADGQGQAWEAAPLGEAQTPFVSARPATPRLTASLVGFWWAQAGVSASFVPARLADSPWDLQQAFPPPLRHLLSGFQVLFCYIPQPASPSRLTSL